MPARRVLCLVLFPLARALGLVFLVLCLVLLLVAQPLVAFRVLVFPVRACQVPCLVLERQGLAPRGCPVCPDPLCPRLRLRACQASFLVPWPRGCSVLGQSQARFLALWAYRVQVDSVCLAGKAPLSPPCPRPCLATRVPRVLMPPMGNLAQLMAQLVLGLRLPRMGGYLPAAQHGPLSQRPARLDQVRPGQARLAQGRLGRAGLELQAPWLRRRRKITRPH